MRERLREGVLRLLVSPPLGGLLRPLARGTITLFLLHRLADPRLGHPGHSLPALRRAVGGLRKDRVDLLSMEEVLGRLREPERWRGAPPAASFTLDDGYREQVELGAPLLAEYDCPSTLFVSTAFVDGREWPWWDRVETILLLAEPALLTSRSGSPQVPPLHPAHRPTNLPGRRVTAAALVEELRWLSLAQREERLSHLTRRLEVELPDSPPDGYAPAGWSMLREGEKLGMRVGPHGVHHTLLTLEGEEVVREEVAGSWRRLGEEMAEPVPVFAFPDGLPPGGGTREMSIVGEAGLQAGVTGEPRHVRPGEGSSDGPFRLGRFHFPGSLHRVRQVVGGLEQWRGRR